MTEEASVEGEGWQMPPDYERLVKLEKLVLAAVETAQEVCEELAQKTEHDNNNLLRLCSSFSENLELAQMLILEATRKHRHHKQESGSVYPEMNQGEVFLERIDALKSYLTQMQTHLPPTESTGVEDLTEMSRQSSKLDQ